MNPYANTSTDFNGQAQLKLVFPGTKFVPDLDPVTKVPLQDDQTGDYKSGTLVVTLFESMKVSGASPQIRTLAEVKKPMSFTRYRATREEIDSLSVEKLKDYFPELKGEVTEQSKPEATDSEVTKLQSKVDELAEQLAQALELLTKKEEKPEAPEAPEMPEETETPEVQPEDLETDPVEKPNNKKKK